MLSMPFQPWWDVQKHGQGTPCDICGAILVRPKVGQDDHWQCLSCDTKYPDKEVKVGDVDVKNT